MRNWRILTLLALSCLLLACSRSKDPLYYVLNPVTTPTQSSHKFASYRIGLDEVNTPAYLDKPQLSVFCTANQTNLDENHLWAEELEGNVKRVLRANLAAFLPGSVVEVSPWDIKFKPNYQLQVDISQYRVDIQGTSILQAEYVIYKDSELSLKQSVYYKEKLQEVNPTTIVTSMNHNLTRLSMDIARQLGRV